MLPFSSTYLWDSRVSSIAWRTNLSALICQISTRLSIAIRVTWRAVAHKVLTISNASASANSCLSNAMCNINPASVSSLSRTGCPRTKGYDDLYLRSRILAAHLSHKCACPISRLVLTLEADLRAEQTTLGIGRSLNVREENTGSLTIFLSVLDGIWAHPLAFVPRK